MFNRINIKCNKHQCYTMVTPKNMFKFVVKVKGVQVKASKIGEEETKGFAKQIDYIEKILLDRCDFQGLSFVQLCDAIRLRNGKVSKLIFVRVTFGYENC